MFGAGLLKSSLFQYPGATAKAGARLRMEQENSSAIILFPVERRFFLRMVKDYELQSHFESGFQLPFLEARTSADLLLKLLGVTARAFEQQPSVACIVLI